MGKKRRKRQTRTSLVVWAERQSERASFLDAEDILQQYELSCLESALRQAKKEIKVQNVCNHARLSVEVWVNRQVKSLRRYDCDKKEEFTYRFFVGRDVVEYLLEGQERLIDFHSRKEFLLKVLREEISKLSARKKKTITDYFLCNKEGKNTYDSIGKALAEEVGRDTPYSRELIRSDIWKILRAIRRKLQDRAHCVSLKNNRYAQRLVENARIFEEKKEPRPQRKKCRTEEEIEQERREKEVLKQLRLKKEQKMEEVKERRLIKRLGELAKRNLKRTEVAVIRKAREHAWYLIRRREGPLSREERQAKIHLGRTTFYTSIKHLEYALEAPNSYLSLERRYRRELFILRKFPVMRKRICLIISMEEASKFFAQLKEICDYAFGDMGKKDRDET